MAALVEASDGVTGYLALVEHVLTHGERRSPRGLPTIDAGLTVVWLHSVDRCLPLGVGRDVNRRIAAAEAVQLVGRFSSPTLLTRASPNFMRFTEPNGEFHGAYGRRIGNQLLEVARKLHTDPDTRQAVVTLWDPFLDNQLGKRDYPCTVTVTYERHGDDLDMTVFMRSQDVWLGTPFDLFQWGQTLHTLANALQLNARWYKHITASTHIYEDKVHLVERLTDPPPPEDREWQPRGFGYDGLSPLDCVGRAAAIGSGGSGRIADKLTPSEEWYAGQLAPLLG